MKYLLQQVDEESGDVYRLFVKIIDQLRPEGYKEVEFFSLWTGAKDPEMPYCKCRLTMSPEGLENLIKALQS